MADRRDAKPPLLGDIAREGPEGAVQILVGPNLTRFHVPKALLCYYSSYFRGALTGNWKEGDDGIIKLDDVDIPVFQVFVHWLFTQQLPGPHVSDWLQYTVHDPNNISMLKMKIYVFADRFLVDGLRLAIKRVIVGNSKRPYHPRLPTIVHAFNNLRSDDPMLDYLVEYHCLFYTGNKFPFGKLDDLPYSFLLRCFEMHGELNKEAKGKDNSMDKRFDPCDHHEHANLYERGHCEST
ncbi:hypothetical protein K491DRAFT_783291 [Lophiostoma macrostomum CBS 122681]|uniref:BTB domain-containing protein n=1 Tax=Lophiostoma macrostomum CBS 122681 TaxID=1314788 RepID=A0A6A6SR86_9PLEO|nr:hypothetical protein K491DRAFT_783291 [Lophiostoma macrostomum CBS 122681]